jgi:ubiquinone/menaquinone biosynthesis C-methylase UbiE
MDRASRSFWNFVANATSLGRERYDPKERLKNSLFRQGSPRIGIDFIGDVSRHRVIELGCGIGQLISLLAPGTARCVGLDFCEGQLAIAKSTCFRDSSVQLICADANEDFPFADSSFDVFVSIYGAFDFVKRPKDLLNRCRRLVRTTGYGVILSSCLDLQELVQGTPFNLVKFVSGSEGHSLAKVMI